MAPAQVAVSSPLPSTFSNPSTITPIPAAKVSAEEDILTVDSLVRQRAKASPHAIAVAYPRSGIDYVEYTLQQLDVFAYRVARYYQSWIPSRASSAEKPITVALFGPSNFDYLVSMLALAKLGHTVLFLSTRLSSAAIESLVEATGSTYLLADPRLLGVASTVQGNKIPLKVSGIAGPSHYDYPIEVYADTRLDHQLDPNLETKYNIFIIHSSGSTGLPKPIYQPQFRAIANYATSMEMKAFITLPLYHNHGICNFFRALYSGISIHMYNADLPLTQPFLTRIFQQHKFEIFYGVPYALKLLAETEEGIELLRELKIVMYGGSACPDALGELLVENGVNLVGHYGATEVGQLMTSFRPPGDKAWNYVRENDKLKPYLRWVPRGSNLFECTVTDGWPAKVTSNCGDGSYATKDLFEPHPTIPGAWKYIARLDDTIVLVNGEKFNPVMMEGKIRSHRAVTETVVFGSGRPYLGVLIVPASPDASRHEVIEEVFSVIDELNHTNEAYARISRDMIKVLPHDCDFPRTDKGSIIRQAFYGKFRDVIDESYDQAAISSGELQTLSISELQAFIRGLLITLRPDAGDVSADDDFFSLGVDSLQSLQMRTEILKNIDIGGNLLGQNVVFENSSINALSAYLFDLRRGQKAERTAVEINMRELIEKYSSFSQRQCPSSVVVTGATGSLGAHVVAQLAVNDNISTIYAFVRAQNDKDAMNRVRLSLLQRQLYHNLPLSARRKIVALPCDFSSPRLGLVGETYDEVNSSLRSVIHCAWSVNFNIGLASFEKDCIAGVRHLIDLCHAVPSAKPASFNFCSSVSSVARCPQSHIPETLPDYGWAQNMGYSQSKLVAEHICMQAAKATGIQARILRVGQIIADTVHGIWNATEGIPLMMQSAVTIGALPQLEESPSWTPVDVVARAVSDIALSNVGPVIANVTNPNTFDWTEDLLPALRSAGLKFEVVPPKEWVRRLQRSNPDPSINPPIKLVDFFASKYDRDPPPPTRTYDTNVACSLSPSLQTAPVIDPSFVAKFVNRFQTGDWTPVDVSQVSSAQQQKRVIILMGPSESGKSTVGEAFSKRIQSAYVEGDSLHTSRAVAQMRAGEPLLDEDQFLWLRRIQNRVLETLNELEYDTVVVSCSALKRTYRDLLRTMRQEEFLVCFVDLQMTEEGLLGRLQRRVGHYMSTRLLKTQLETYESPEVEETDVFPVDTDCATEDALDQIELLLRSFTM
ncbi:NRPS-like enzyme [Periconia macrospinosa]|uniref:gluconokinase n=1 Tax=Periconia macrospinosa TaxID=97972 RepID=A0A2V1DJ21_9PLEO|nr:NRPS-like enzyme [Periconia macrospinosa]